MRRISRRKAIALTAVPLALGGILTSPTAQAQAPGAIFASWSHGNVTVAENPENIVSSMHVGSGPVFFMSPGSSSWFHAPISTPVVTNSAHGQ
jgi:hypothetical protein